MDCVITAGGLAEPGSPMFEVTQGKPKALLDMNGRAMLERVLDAVQASKYIEDVVVVGLGDDKGMSFQRPVQHLPDQGSLLANALAGINLLRAQKPTTEMILVGSADIPTITSKMLDDFIDSCQPFDKSIYYNFVTREVMEKRFPGSNRSFIKLKGVEIAGGDMTLVHGSLADGHHDLWEAITNARKHAWMLARIVGFRFLFKFLLGRLSTGDIETVFERMVGQPASVVLCPYAEMGMDADKPHQVELLRRDLTERGA